MTADRGVRYGVGRRVSVVGTTGSGKTATARQLAGHLGVPHVELDALQWGPDWTPAGEHVFRERVIEAARGDAWVIDGNYSRVRNIVWSRAQTVVWLDYGFLVVMWQLAGRTVRRVIKREELWQGNRETFRKSFLSRDSILLWALQTYRRRRRDYPALLRRPEYAHLAAVRLRSPSATREWLRNFAPHQA